MSATAAPGIWTPELWKPGTGWVPHVRDLTGKARVFVTPRAWRRAKEEVIESAVTLQQQGTNVNGATTGATNTFVWGVAPVTGNILIICAWNNDNATGPSISGSGATWTKQNYFRGDASHDNVALWTGVVGVSPTTTAIITWNAGAAAGPFAIMGVEFAGTQATIDGTPTTPTNVASTTPSITSNTPSQTGQLAVAFCGQVGTTAPTATPAGWTTLTRNGASIGADGAWLVLSTAAAVSPTWTFAASQFSLLECVIVNVAGGVAPMGGRIFNNRRAAHFRASMR